MKDQLSIEEEIGSEVSKAKEGGGLVFHSDMLASSNHSGSHILLCSFLTLGRILTTAIQNWLKDSARLRCYRLLRSPL